MCPFPTRIPGGLRKQESEDVGATRRNMTSAQRHRLTRAGMSTDATPSSSSLSVVAEAAAAAAAIQSASPRSPSAPTNRPFVLKPIPSSISPVLVFINPKSGGNQGAKLMQKFQWLLNPRQVFDIMDGGPRPAVELFRKVANARLLACGGDGTVGWLLKVMDQMQLAVQPPVGVLPLGTGNDLSRSLGNN